MRKRNEFLKKLGVIFLAFALVFSGLVIYQPMETQAAVKPTKISVKTSNSLLGTSKTIYIGGPSSYKTTKLAVSVSPSKASKSVTYKSSNSKVASVSSKGVVTAKKKGTATITVTSKVNKKLKTTVKITVKQYVYPTKMTVTASKSLYGGKTTTLKTAFSPKSPTDKKVTYKSSNTALATVSASGVVKANSKNKTGTVKITVTARAKTSKSKVLKKTVSIKILPTQVSSVKLNASSKTLTKTGITPNPTTKLTATVSPSNAYDKKITWTSSNTNVATVKNGTVTAKNMGEATITAKTSNGKKATCKVTVTKNQVSVHDPSIVKGTDGYYYIFGSHMAWARSKSLMGWNTFTNNINRQDGDYTSIFKDYWNNWAKYNNRGAANRDNLDRYISLNENEWAPDVIWNPNMKKWCMYMSVNGPDYNSVIVLCTADSLTGNWTAVGPVVYSGFTNRAGISGHNVQYTDYKKVTGESTVASRYLNWDGTWNSAYGINAIDPCVKFDDNGDLWMVYGSWFGGIHALKLDKNTGLRDYSKTYALQANASDPYWGIQIAGGNGVSGEAPYLIKNGGYWYLFLSYGGLEAQGGYNMRVFRSKNITGPYVDKKGQSAIYKNWTDNIRGTTGIRLMSGYKWSCNSKAYLAQGHNSAQVDSDGKMYLVYHTRYANNGEYHDVRVHQMFMSEDGWLCTAPYEYNGETISKTGYTKSELTGTYEYIRHTPSVANGGYVTGTTIALSADGQIKVNGVKTGTWTVKNGTPYATFVFSGITYKGVFSYGYDESTNRKKVMTFSAIGSNNICIWGSKK